MKNIRLLILFWYPALRNNEVIILLFSALAAVGVACVAILFGYEMKNTGNLTHFRRELSIVLFLIDDFILATVLCLASLFPFLIQKMEQSGSINKLYSQLPIHYWQLFLARWLGTIIFMSVYVGLSHLIVFTSGTFIFSGTPYFDSNYMRSTLLNQSFIILIDVIGYVSLLVLLSFFIDNMLLGFATLILFYGLQFVEALWFLPSAFPSARLHYYKTGEIYPDSNFVSEQIVYPEIGSLIFSVVFIYASFSLGSKLIFNTTNFGIIGNSFQNKD